MQTTAKAIFFVFAALNAVEARYNEISGESEKICFHGNFLGMRMRQKRQGIGLQDKNVQRQVSELTAPSLALQQCDSSAFTVQKVVAESSLHSLKNKLIMSKAFSTSHGFIFFT